MVGEQEPVGADEGARAAVIETYARQPHMVEPLLRGRESILLLQLLDGDIVEGPHALFRLGMDGDQAHCNQRGCDPMLHKVTPSRFEA